MDEQQPGEREFLDEALIYNSSVKDHHLFTILCYHKNDWDYSINDNVSEFSVMLDLGVSQYVKILFSNISC